MSDLFQRLADRGVSDSGSTVVPTQLVWAGKSLDNMTESSSPEVTETRQDVTSRKPPSNPPEPTRIIETRHYSQETIIHAKTPVAQNEKIDQPQPAPIKMAVPQAAEAHSPVKQPSVKPTSQEQKHKDQRRKPDDAKQSFHTTERIIEKEVGRRLTSETVIPNVFNTTVVRPANAPQSKDIHSPPPAAPITIIQPVSQQIAPPQASRQEMRKVRDPKPPVTITIGPIRVTAPKPAAASVTQAPIAPQAPAGAELKSWLGWNTG